MSHDIDALVSLAEASYNRPPAAPRELMWSRITDRRSASRPARRSFALPAAGLGMAATLVLGIGLGRMSTRPTVIDAPERPVAVAPVSEPVRAPGTSEPPPAPSVNTGRSGRPEAVGTSPVIPGERETSERRERLVRPAPVDAPGPGPRFALATSDYIAQTEALLAHFDAGGRPADLEEAFLFQARDLLLTTRVLLDSRIGNDPEMAQLLDDLELVLTQASQLRTGSQTDLFLVSQAIGRHDLLQRVRVAKLNPASLIET